MVFASTGGTIAAVFVVVAVYVLVALPAYVIGKRRGVSAPGVAFVPLVGSTIVILWSIERSGWLAILGLIPIVAIVFAIWLVFTLPADHGRTRWWGLAFLIPGVNVIAFYVYAFTLEDATAPSSLAA
jgi:hypothetical protein